MDWMSYIHRISMMETKQKCGVVFATRVFSKKSSVAKNCSTHYQSFAYFFWRPFFISIKMFLRFWILKIAIFQIFAGIKKSWAKICWESHFLVVWIKYAKFQLNRRPWLQKKFGFTWNSCCIFRKFVWWL